MEKLQKLEMKHKLSKFFDRTSASLGQIQFISFCVYFYNRAWNKAAFLMFPLPHYASYLWRWH